MLDFLMKKVKIRGAISPQKLDQIFDKLSQSYPGGIDPWGLNLKRTQKVLKMLYPLYKNYFKTRVFGQENVEDRPYILVSNHSGQIALDGLLLTIAFLVEMKQPRILRSMVERFVPRLPFLGMWMGEGGAVLGDRQNCLNLLERGESLLVFPEGVRGVSKSTAHYYELQKFSQGFFRMALRAEVDILPVAIVGAEEIFPWVYQAKGLAKALKLPSLPLSPLYFPLPSPVDIYIGQPYRLPHGLSAESSDALLGEHINSLEEEIKKLIQTGLKKRRPFWASVKGGKK